MVEKLIKLIFVEEEIKDILDKVIMADAELAKYVLSNEEKSEYKQITILMNGQISRPWFQNCHSILSLAEVIWTNARYYHQKLRAFLEGIRTNILLSSQLGTLHKLKLGAA